MATELLGHRRQATTNQKESFSCMRHNFILTFMEEIIEEVIFTNIQNLLCSKLDCLFLVSSKNHDVLQANGLPLSPALPENLGLMRRMVGDKENPLNIPDIDERRGKSGVSRAGHSDE
ncbi:hypothetical protein WUBG_16352 [Wuchereria bancrofti]|uniref:Uncharacterized protein n=1 Tax=Wuchereria bancrofti TaxID=6293 RepID=J9EBH3_WUCBA|nr:hypothetical protein WUBG_16352 [Wuchereria bancrofti]